MKNNCKICNISFNVTKENNHRKYCSTECRKKARLQREREKRPMRKCVICGKSFYNSKHTQITCSKDCSIVRRKEYCKSYNKEYHSENSDKIKERRDKNYLKNKETEYRKHREWVEKNRAKVYLDNKQYYHDNKKRLRAMEREWIKKNVYRKRYLNHKHIDNRKYSGDIENISPDEFERIKKIFVGCCFCGNTSDLTIEHLIPVSKNGKTEIGNILFSCSSCNSSKRDKDVKEWYKSQPFYNKINLLKIQNYMINNI